MSSRWTSVLLSLCGTCSMICWTNQRHTRDQWVSIYFLFVKRCDDYLQLLRFFIKIKGIMFHWDIKLCKILLTRDPLHNIKYNRYWILFAYVDEQRSEICLTWPDNKFVFCKKCDNHAQLLGSSLGLNIISHSDIKGLAMVFFEKKDFSRYLDWRRFGYRWDVERSKSGQE